VALWDERQPGESSKAWAAFAEYRDLLGDRSITRAWRKFTKREAGESGTWELWARKFRWVERAAAYDSHLDAKKRAVRERLLAELVERRADYEIRVQDKLEKRVEKLEAILEKYDPLPVTDIERSEEKEVTVKESGVVEVRTVKTKVKGINASGHSRLNQEFRRTMQQAVVGLRPSSETLPSTDDGIKELASAIRNSPD
jgi:hypothetical protein